jgi:hypothetical protein
MGDWLSLVHWPASFRTPLQNGMLCVTMKKMARSYPLVNGLDAFCSETLSFNVILLGSRIVALALQGMVGCILGRPLQQKRL